jgi:hypothetical protein
MNLIFLAFSIFIIPFIFNFKINSESLIYPLLVGLLFGLLIIPISLKTHSDSIITNGIFKQIAYWTILLCLNISYTLHRSEYKERKYREDLSDKRDSIIDSIINPVRNKFIQ